MKYIQLSIKCSNEINEIVSYILMQNGAGGVSIVDKNDYINLINSKNMWDYVDPDLIKSYNDFVYIKCCFKTNQKKEIEKIKAEIKNITQFYTNCVCEISESILEDKNWKTEWKKFYKPLIFNNLVIKPKWIKEKFTDKKVVNIDPSMAFGTGQHESTANCLLLMQELNLDNKTVLDLGCGSGILGLSALKLGAKECTFLDIDENAIKVCKQNAKLNKLSKCFFYVSDNIKMIKEKFDLIFANLTVDLLTLYLTQIKNALSNDGFLIISGIIDSRQDEIINKFKTVNIFPIKHIQKGDWHSYICQIN